MCVSHRFEKWLWGLAAFFLLSLGACQVAQPPAVPLISESILVSPTWTAAFTPVPSSTPTEAPLQSPTKESTSTPPQAVVPAAISTPSPVFYEPAGCKQPPDDYNRVSIHDHILNSRTHTMLQWAAQLYGGEIDVVGKAIIQGSYNDTRLESSDTDFGGEVDISVTIPGSSHVLYTEIEPLIRALRTAGFAAWLRDDGEMKDGLGIHIHAIAIGDRDLSPAAQEQITGPFGYLRGYAGLPNNDGIPVPDRYGGPLICRWMLETGYTDLRAFEPTPTPDLPWQERLRQAALAYQAFYPEDAEKIARSLNFLDGKTESAENICGPLSAAILRDAGLLPNQPGPVQDIKSYWQARPSDNGRPWSMFSKRDYEVFHFDTPLAEFDFSAWPLQPADFIYSYAIDHGFEHMFVVSEVDADGRAYTVTNQFQAWGNQLWGSMLILRYMLYDPHTPGAGIIYNEWSDRNLGSTGNNGFDVLRKRGLEAGSLYAYIVRPGDTLPELANRFGASSESLAQANPGLDLANLQVGQSFTIPIPSYSPSSPEPAQDNLP